MTEDVTNYTHGRLVLSTYTVTLQSLLAPGPKVHSEHFIQTGDCQSGYLGKQGLHSKDTPYCHFKYTSVFSIAVSQSPCSQGLDGCAPAPTHLVLLLCLVF